MFDVRAARKRRQAPGEQYSQALDELMSSRQYPQGSADVALAGAQASPLDSPQARQTHRQLLEWYYLEREKQAMNRLEMALDADFYDNLQWDPQDAADLRSRGQMPLVFNEVAPMVDWLIGTERRTRVDWKVLPRTEDDVQNADTKTKVLKYISDVNRVSFARSRSFSDAAKVGVGWVDDGARDDPTADILYSKYQDWRNVLWDSASYELDLSDARYLFRWRWVDVDVACAMFPARSAQILRSMEEGGFNSETGEDDDTWVSSTESDLGGRSGRLTAQGIGLMVDAKRRRVRLIEAQYRMPARVTLIADGPLRGLALMSHDRVLNDLVAATRPTLMDKIMMRTHIAVMTEADLLEMGPSPYRHNRFSLTPIWAYRRSRDRLPYGAIRRVRDIQQDLNKRASKALWLVNTNQVIVDAGAVEDLEVLREEASMPDGLLVKKAGAELKIQRDTDAAAGQIQMMTLDANSIQRSAGVADENLGRQTNAVSGEAIKARQLQGSVVTTELFDNLRLAVQVQGEKQLSLAEQFYTEEKVIRLTGARGALEWVRINQPELQADGSVRFINDMTASQADFIVSEADYAGTLRQVMFDSLVQLSQRLEPQVALRLLTMAFEFSDLPNKDEIADMIRSITGERDPRKELTPEEAQQQAEQMQQQAEALQIQRQMALTTLDEASAKVREINARAAKLEAEAQAALAGPAGAEGQSAEMEAALREVQSAAAREIERLSSEVSTLQSKLTNETLRIRSDKDAKVQVARIQADGQARAAEIQAASDAKLQAMLQRIDQLQAGLDARIAKVADDAKAQVQALQAQRQAEEAAAPAEPAAAPPAPITVNVQVDAKAGPVTKTVTLERGPDGEVRGGTVTEEHAADGEAPAAKAGRKKGSKP